MKVILIESNFVINLKGSDLKVINECLDYNINNSNSINMIQLTNLFEGISELLKNDNDIINKEDSTFVLQMNGLELNNILNCLNICITKKVVKKIHCTQKLYNEFNKLFDINNEVLEILN